MLLVRRMIRVFAMNVRSEREQPQTHDRAEHECAATAHALCSTERCGMVGDHGGESLLTYTSSSSLTRVVRRAGTWHHAHLLIRDPGLFKPCVRLRSFQLCG